MTGLRLHMNENTGGCSPRVVEAIRGMQATDLALYPEYGPYTEACAQHFGVPPEWVVLTNGLDEGVLLTALGHIARERAFDAEVIIPVPAFDSYPWATAAVGATPVRVPAGDDFAFPVAAVLEAITRRTRLVFLNTPNNPTGRLIAREDLARVAEAAPHAAVLVDETYIEIGGTSFLPDLPRHPNVIVGRSFSKVYGLAGLRIGCLIGHPDILQPVRAVTPLKNVNHVALVALLAALDDQAFASHYISEVRASRQIVYATCSRLGLRYWPSEGNFVLLDVGDPVRPVLDALQAAGLTVRDRSTDPYSPGCLRVTTGLTTHTQAAMDALEAALAGRQSS